MAKPDAAHRLTDKELAALEQRIAAEYKKAAEEMQDKINDYFEKLKKRYAEQLNKLKEGEITKTEFKTWVITQTGRGSRLKDLRNKLAERWTNAAEVARAYVNDTTPGIYSLNRNYAAYTIEQQVGADVAFTLWDEQTVRRLVVENPDIMPYYPAKRAFDRGIDLKWGKQQITNCVVNGLLQGDSIKHMSDRLQKSIPTMSRNSAIKAARTAVTAAQNAGRMDSYDAAQRMGIKLKKRWLSTLDGRTRHSHQLLDGQTREVDKPFDSILGEIMYPGDPNAVPANVYQCRCTMIADVEGVYTGDGLRRDKWGLVPNMTYAQWANTKRGEGLLAADFYAKKESERNIRDRKQFVEYKALLGNEMPKTFSTFQKWKYEKPEKWKELQKEARKARKDK